MKESDTVRERKRKIEIDRERERMSAREKERESNRERDIFNVMLLIPSFSIYYFFYRAV